MVFISRLFALLGLRFFRAEWFELQQGVNFLLKTKEGRDRASILAQELLISGEDHRFFKHGGIDIIAIFRAIWRRIFLNKHEGASTIEMQVVRVVTGRFEKTFMRKFREMALASLLTRVISKSEIPAFYLTIGYYGWRMNGLGQARKRLFPVGQFSDPIQAAELVARLKYPQPHLVSRVRQRQISLRGQHLLDLYSKHKLKEIYFGLNAKTAHKTI